LGYNLTVPLTGEQHSRVECCKLVELTAILCEVAGTADDDQVLRRIESPERPNQLMHVLLRCQPSDEEDVLPCSQLADFAGTPKNLVLRCRYAIGDVDRVVLVFRCVVIA